jgi:hypothetical protein
MDKKDEFTLVKNEKSPNVERVGRLPTSFHKRSSTMGNISQNSVLRKSLQHLMLHAFRCPLADHYSKKLTVGAAITLFVEAQLQQRRTLSDIVLNLEMNAELQGITGITTIHESTLNRKLDTIPLAYLEWLFAELVQELKKANSKCQRDQAPWKVSTCRFNEPFAAQNTRRLGVLSKQDQGCQNSYAAPFAGSGVSFSG